MAAHAAVGQRRKYSDEPYIVHPLEACAILQSLPILNRGTPSEEPAATIEMQMAMLLHDTVEDTRAFLDGGSTTRAPTREPVANPAKHFRQGNLMIVRDGISLDLIKAEFGDEVCRITEGLTDVSMPWDGNREARKALDIAHTAAGDYAIKTCKLADVISNAPSIIEHDPGFAVKWMGEKEKIADACSDVGNPILIKIASEIISCWKARRSLPDLAAMI